MESRNKLRNDLRRAKKCGKDSDTVKLLAWKFHQLLRQYKKISRAEQKSSNEQTEQRERRQCAEGLHRFAKSILDGNNSCEPDFDASTAQNFFKTVYNSEEREFHHPSWLPVAPSPAHPFDEGPLSPEELEHVIRRVRSSASPSPLDQIPYQVLHRCPSIHSALLHLFNIC